MSAPFAGTRFGDDPELIATFQAEVEERLAELVSGLEQLEAAPSPRQAVAALFRAAHTVKGSARMLGLTPVVLVAHAAEDLLGALREGRFGVTTEHVDVLLAACDVISRALPGARSPLADPAEAELVVVSLQEATGGRGRSAVPSPRPAASEPADARGGFGAGPLLAVEAEPRPAVEEALIASTETVRVTTTRLRDLLDVVGEAELGARRVGRASAVAGSEAQETARWAQALQAALGEWSLPPQAELALHRLGVSAERLQGAAGTLLEVAGAHADRVAEVRDGALGLAMVPLGRLVSGYPRLVRDLCRRSGKQVRLELSGEHVEIDKQVLDTIADALSHLVTNAVDHGVETPEQRRSAGKPPTATVAVRARGAGGTVVVEVADDGRGVDPDAVRAAATERGLLASDAGPVDAYRLLFTPGLSTAREVTETSGRGVGLDVVRTTVEHLGGTVTVMSEPGVGTTFSLTLPVTLGVLHCLLARAGDERYAIPVTAVVETLALRDLPRAEVAGAPVVVRAGTTLPLLDLAAALGTVRPTDAEPRSVLVVRHGDRLLAWAVDRLEGEAELVVRELGPFLGGRVPGVTGATIDADGAVVCLLDLREVAEQALTGHGAPVGLGVGQPSTPAAARVLVVEDSVGVRELERVVLEGAGYRVETAVDGLEGAGRLQGPAMDLVLTDVEMPGMDGFTLTRTVRRTAGWERVPVVIMTSCGSEADQQAGLEAGADAYLLKNEFDQTTLVETVRRLIGR